MKKYLLIVSVLFLISCQKTKNEEPKGIKIGDPETTSIKGFYLLNEGSFGGNNASLDYYNYQNGYYQKDIYLTSNPNVVMDLGDVGTDLKIYGSKLYAAINSSNKIEVMKKENAQRIAQVNIANVRYITFDGGYMYATSYAGPIDLDTNQAQRGYVAKIDTSTFQIIDTVVVGYQPEEMAVLNGKLYVANSGGYLVHKYERTVSVIDLSSFQVTGEIDVAVNLHRIRADKRGNLWVSSRGDYFSIPSRLYRIYNNVLAQMIDVPVSDLCVVGDSIYITGVQWSNETGSNTISYALVSANEGSVLDNSLIKDGTNIIAPYGIAVNPVTKDFYITDAKDYSLQGEIYCFGANGYKKWQLTVGKLPATFAFVRTNF
ncbi:MAG: YncE family protein [Bacteroidales bacterium]|jgi:DNA-binding beta-propeller fold protein YncE|nr:YncE family protein [Bacteroidales bacterium]